jgi:hypothetical protein
MNKFSLGLAALFMLMMVIIMAPNVLALNRGKVLRNIAIWLAVILALALAYQVFGPGSPHSLFAPAAMMAPDEAATPSSNDKNGSDKNGGDKSFIPPGE